MLHVSYFFVFRLLHTPALDSFPTRRSSDLIFLQAELEDGDGRAREHQHARGDDKIDTNRFGREHDHRVVGCRLSVVCECSPGREVTENRQPMTDNILQPSARKMRISRTLMACAQPR